MNLGKQVFVTINIIPRSEELEQLPTYLFTTSRNRCRCCYSK